MTALAGVRVLDLSRILAGPWCTQTLADLGADVVKVERPPVGGHGGGDDTRTWGPPFWTDAQGQPTDRSAYFICANRNKRSVALDLAHPQGQALVRRLAACADVVVENHKVGGLARYGLDAASLMAVNPGLVYCSITGFGQDGPWATRAGYDLMIQGLSGLMSITGAPDDEPGGGPQKVGVAVVDVMTGMYAATAILAALRHRDRTGQGQVIDTALFDVSLAMLANVAENHLVSGTVPLRYGNAHANIVPYQSFATADGHMLLAVGNDGQFSRFCEVIGLPALAQDPRFATNSQRNRHRNDLVPVLAERLLTRSTQDWVQALECVQVPCGPIHDVAQALAHEQAQARSMVRHWPAPEAGPSGAPAAAPPLPYVASPIHLSATPVQDRMPPPALGAHTRQALQDWLGVSPQELSAWQSAGVLHWPDDPGPAS